MHEASTPRCTASTTSILSIKSNLNHSETFHTPGGTALYLSDAHHRTDPSYWCVNVFTMLTCLSITGAYAMMHHQHTFCLKWSIYVCPPAKHTLCITRTPFVWPEPYMPYDAKMFVHRWYVACASLVHLLPMRRVRSVWVMTRRMCETFPPRYDHLGLYGPWWMETVPHSYACKATLQSQALTFAAAFQTRHSIHRANGQKLAVFCQDLVTTYHLNPILLIYYGGT